MSQYKVGTSNRAVLIYCSKALSKDQNVLIKKKNHESWIASVNL